MKIAVWNYAIFWGSGQFNIGTGGCMVIHWTAKGMYPVGGGGGE